MNDSLKRALDQVQAEQALKDSTKAFLAQKTKGYTGTKRRRYPALILAACLLLALVSGHWLYFTATVEISIDINPSIELGVNRFDKVIWVSGYNDDGEKLADSLELKYLDYTDAVSQITESEQVAELLSHDGIMAIGVAGDGSGQAGKVLSELESCTAEQGNTYCYYATAQEAEEARELGLSYGKYRAYLELQALDPAVTPEHIQGMTMREIRDAIDSLTGEEETETQSESETGFGSGGRGNGKGNRFGQGQGNRRGQNS